MSSFLSAHEGMAQVAAHARRTQPVEAYQAPPAAREGMTLACVADGVRTCTVSCKQYRDGNPEGSPIAATPAPEPLLWQDEGDQA